MRRLHPLSAISLESLVESDGALRSVSVERKSEKHFRWNTLMHKFRGVSEPEFSVVIRMSHEATSLGIYISQS